MQLPPHFWLVTMPRFLQLLARVVQPTLPVSVQIFTACWQLFAVWHASGEAVAASKGVTDSKEMIPAAASDFNIRFSKELGLIEALAAIQDEHTIIQISILSIYSYI